MSENSLLQESQFSFGFSAEPPAPSIGENWGRVPPGVTTRDDVMGAGQLGCRSLEKSGGEDVRR